MPASSAPQSTKPIPKKKINANIKTGKTISRLGIKKSGPVKGKYVSPMISKLSMYKTDCGQKFYCPICNERIFCRVPSLLRHIKQNHPSSDLLKLSTARRKAKKYRGKVQSDSDSDSPSDEKEDDDDTDAEIDNLPNGSDDEVEVEPEKQECVEENGFIEAVSPQKSDNESDFVDVEATSPSSFLLSANITKELEIGAIDLEEKLQKKVQLKLEQTISPARSVKIKHETSAGPDSMGRWCCVICPEKDRPTYSHFCSLDRHMQMKHGGLSGPKKVELDDDEKYIKGQSTSPERRQPISRPRRKQSSSTHFCHNVDTSSNEEIPGTCTRLELKIERLPPIIKPMSSELDHVDKEEGIPEENKERTEECSICFKIFSTKKARATHEGWHRRNNGIGWEAKKSKLLFESDDIVKDDLMDEVEVAPDVVDQLGPTLQLDLSNQEVETRTNNDGDEEMTLGEILPLNDQDLGGDELAEPDTEIADSMNDTQGNVVNCKCMFCPEWFSSSMELADHIVNDHSSRANKRVHQQE